MRVRNQIALAVLSLTIIIGCQLPNPKTAFNTIIDSAAIVKADFAGISQKLQESPPDIATALNLAKDGYANAGKIPSAGTEAQKDYNLLKSDDDAVRASYGYRIEQFLIGSFWACVITGIVLLVVVIVFPGLFSAFGAAGGVLGEIVRQIHAFLPFQNLGNWINSFLKKKIIALPATSVVVPKIPGVTISNASSGMPIA